MLVSYFLVAIGLAMDAFAVSISSGICIPDLRPRHALRAASAFGLFQFLMPVAGWLLGSTFRGLILVGIHWIAFGLLAVVGCKMIFEAIKARNEEACEDDAKAASILNLPGLLVLSVATSIDALAVGLSYSVLGTPILLPAAIIGLVTFALCVVGCEFGKRIGARFERWATLAGGIVLVGIGAKIAIEHLVKAV